MSVPSVAAACSVLLHAAICRRELAIEIDRERAADLGVPVAQIAASLRSLMAADPIGTLKDGGRVIEGLL